MFGWSFSEDYGGESFGMLNRCFGIYLRFRSNLSQETFNSFLN